MLDFVFEESSSRPMWPELHFCVFLSENNGERGDGIGTYCVLLYNLESTTEDKFELELCWQFYQIRGGWRVLISWVDQASCVLTLVRGRIEWLRSVSWEDEEDKSWLIITPVMEILAEWHIGYAVMSWQSIKGAEDSVASTLVDQLLIASVKPTADENTVVLVTWGNKEAQSDQ